MFSGGATVTGGATVGGATVRGATVTSTIVDWCGRSSTVMTLVGEDGDMITFIGNIIPRGADNGTRADNGTGPNGIKLVSVT